MSPVCHEADSPGGVEPDEAFVVGRKRVPNLRGAAVQVQDGEAAVFRNRNQVPLWIGGINQNAVRHENPLSEWKKLASSRRPISLSNLSPKSMFVKKFSKIACSRARLC